MKGNKGITLIALVITIIVLLILAGVSIAMLSGDNSILGNASKSADANKIGEVEDLISMKVSENVMAYLDYKYNNATSTDTIITAADNSPEKVVVETIKSFTGSGSNKPSNGVTVEYTTGTVTITSNSYKAEGTVNETKGTVTWKPVEKVTT